MSDQSIKRLPASHKLYFSFNLFTWPESLNDWLSVTGQCKKKKEKQFVCATRLSSGFIIPKRKFLKISYSLMSVWGWPPEDYRRLALQLTLCVHTIQWWPLRGCTHNQWAGSSFLSFFLFSGQVNSKEKNK